MLAELAIGKDIVVGKLGCISFPPAFYAYVGSAMGGFSTRLAHHLRKEKKLHWHIDYLLEQADIREVILCRSEKKIECFLAQALAREFPSVSGFGSSDCKCQSHLYFARGNNSLKAKVTEAINRVDPTCEVLPEAFVSGTKDGKVF